MPGVTRDRPQMPCEEEGVPPAQLTSILQVMIPGSLPTALKALLRDMVLVFPGLQHHRVSGADDDASLGRQPSSFSPKSFPSILSAVLPRACGAPCTVSRRWGK